MHEMIVMKAVYWGGRWLRHGDGSLSTYAPLTDSLV